jgi:AcrR family transcriptional regulator
MSSRAKPFKPHKPLKEDGRVSRAQRLRESRRAAVLGVARTIFANQGYHATSIDDIIEGAGIARGTFYLYFESKRAIFDELLDELFAKLRAVVHRIEVGPGAAPPIDQMHVIVERVLETLQQNRELARILLREAVGIDADFDRKLADFWGRIRGMMESAIRNGQTMGLVRECDSGVVAHCILGLVKEAVGWVFVEASHDKDHANPPNLKELAREMIAFTLTGLFKIG